MRKRAIRTAAVGLAALVVGAAAALAATPGLNLPWRSPLGAQSYTGSRVTVTWALATYTKLLVASYSKPDPGEHVDTTRVTCHGGVADVEWYVGDLEPERPSSGMHISAFMDGKEIGTLIKGGRTGVWEDGPAELRTVVRCARGRHTLWVTFGQGKAFWGVPYADANDRVQRGFIVREYWG